MAWQSNRAVLVVWIVWQPAGRHHRRPGLTWLPSTGRTGQASEGQGEHPDGLGRGFVSLLPHHLEPVPLVER